MFFFPNPYSDELLYSALARYCVQSGNISSIKNFEDIFGSRKIIASVELPGNLESIVSNLPANSKYSSEYFIYNNTLFPYIASFLPEMRAKEVKELMKKGQSSSTYSKAGYISGNITQNRKFKFCTECMKEDLQNYGEMFWHRIHQVTEVHVCPKHKLALCESNTPMRGNNRQSFIPATTDACCMADAVPYSNDMLEKLLWIAEDVQTILNRKFTFQSIENHKRLYLEKLINKKYANFNSMTHQKKLRKELLQFWGEDVLNLVQCPISPESDCNWLNFILRNNNAPSQPIRNILLMRFLGISIDELFQPVSVGMKSHKEVWEDKLIELANKKISLRQMAIELNSTTKTVKRYIEKLGIEPFWNDNGGRRYIITYKNTQEFCGRQDGSRKDWIQLLKENPKLSRNKIRKLNETLYSWLMRNDKAWLDSNSPKIRSNKDINWSKRDEELLPKVKKIIEEMQEGKPERILWTTIGGKLGNCGIFIKSKEKLPLTKEYIEQQIETLQKFHIRKILWAIDELERENKSITKWKLLEKAGVKYRYINYIYVDISEALRNKGYDENLLK